jgi:peptidoglycan hydrolase CwlO-like protein
MRKSILPLLVVALLLVSGLTAWLLVQNHDSKLAYQDLSASEEASRQSYNHTIDAIAQIQDSLDAITPRDSAFQVIPGSLATEQDMAGPDSRKALERIATLRASIERSRNRIRALEASLRHSDARVGSLNRMVANLQRDLADRQKMLDEVSARVEALQNQVGSLQVEVAQAQETVVARDATIEDRRRELATVYYVIGTQQDLTKQGAVVSTGGVLGFGKTLVPSGSLPAESVIPLDTDSDTVVKTESVRARVITPQPASSYELRPVDGHMELHILNPEEFRKVRQLVIVTT